MLRSLRLPVKPILCQDISRPMVTPRKPVRRQELFGVVIFYPWKRGHGPTWFHFDRELVSLLVWIPMKAHRCRHSTAVMVALISRRPIKPGWIFVPRGNWPTLVNIFYSLRMGKTSSNSAPTPRRHFWNTLISIIRTLPATIVST